MAESIREEDRKLKVQKNSEQENQKKQEAKAFTDEERMVERVAAKDKVSKEEAKKKVAKETVKKETGYNAEALARVGIDALNAKDAMEKPSEVGETTKDLQRLRGEAVQDMLGRIQDNKVAENVIKSGLSSMHLSTGKGGLQQGARTVLEKEREIGGGAGMEDLLKEAVLYGNGLTLSEVKELKKTPEQLKEYVDQLKENHEQQKKNSDKKDLPPEAYKGGAGR